MPDLDTPDVAPSWQVPASRGPRLRRQAWLPVAVLPRNGLPEGAPYVYRGTGEDIYLGSYGDPLLDEPGS